MERKFEITINKGWLGEIEELNELDKCTTEEFEAHYTLERLVKPHFLDLHKDDELSLALKHLSSYQKITIIRNELERRGVLL